MFERFFERIDILPGMKTTVLATCATALFWGHVTGIVPPDLFQMAMPWILGFMSPTLVAKLLRK